MTGGKRKLAQLFTSQMKVDGSGTAIKRLLAGSVGFAQPGCVTDAAELEACTIAEVTISNLSPCAIMVANAEGLSGCWRYDSVIAGDGQASVVLMLTSLSQATGASIDARSGGVLRYIAFNV